ncbi:MAG: hypothetical protein VKK98_10360 [Cyanobacteriota bacterium]|nr:hypothetical protein [Cyanobacteriota bacterium]
MESLSSEQRDELQAFLKDWLRHAGRTQADLRRALHAGSIRMPVLIDVLAGTYAQGGINGLAAQLCAIEERWQQEEDWQGDEQASSSSDPFGQLDLLLREIRSDSDG